MATKTIATIEKEISTVTAQRDKLDAKLAQLEAQKTQQSAVFSAAIDTEVTVVRRNGGTAVGYFKGAKETERGILVAVQVGEGFEAELLRLPVSKVRFDRASEDSGVHTSEDGLAQAFDAETEGSETQE